ncbi:MAG: Flp family type IVb pilin [Janthinobacterium lividum]
MTLIHTVRDRSGRLVRALTRSARGVSRDRTGTASLEYALIGSVIAVTITAGATQFGVALQTSFVEISRSLEHASAPSCVDGKTRLTASPSDQARQCAAPASQTRPG